MRQRPGREAWCLALARRDTRFVAVRACGWTGRSRFRPRIWARRAFTCLALVAVATLCCLSGVATAATDGVWHKGLPPGVAVPEWARNRPIHFDPSPYALAHSRALSKAGSVPAPGGLGTSELSPLTHEVNPLYGESNGDTGPLLYHGGPVLTSPEVHVIFWGQPWSTIYLESAEEAVKTFFANISGSAYHGILTQYIGHNGSVGSGISVSYYWDDEVPAENIEGGGAEAEKAIEAMGWRTGTNALFVVLADGTYAPGFGEENGNVVFCGYHQPLEKSKVVREESAFAFIPYAGGGRFTACGGPEDSPEAANHTEKTVSHEFAESETDPLVGTHTAWDSVQGEEVADLCVEPPAYVSGLGEVNALWDDDQGGGARLQTPAPQRFPSPRPLLRAR